MATEPGAPIISLEPLSSNQTLEFAWDPPTSDGGSPVLGYRLQLNAETPIDVGLVIYYAVTGLTNGTNYLASIEAYNAIGTGPKAFFRSFQPGSATPAAPSSCTVVSGATSNAAVVSWTPPVTTPDATIFWYVIEGISNNPADPVIRRTANGLTQTSLYIDNLNVSSAYTFNVYAVNCPGYSPPLSTTLSRNEFAPTALSGLQMWLDAADANTLTIASDSNVSAWADKSGRANGVSQATASNQPSRYLTANGLSGMRFVAASGGDWFRGLFTTPLSTTKIAAFTVFEMTSNAQNYARVLSLSPLNSNDFINGAFGMNIQRDIGASAIKTNANSSESAAAAITYSTMYVTSVVYDGTSNILNLNGSTIVSRAYNTGFTISRSGIGFQAFSEVSGSADRHDGAINEVILYNSNITPFDTQKVEGYLAWKWGLQGTLPASHPFVSTLPRTTSVFSPSTFINLRLWIDAQDRSSFTLSANSTVTQIVDKSSNAYVFSNATGYNYNVTRFNSFYPSFFTGSTLANAHLGSNNAINVPQQYHIFTVGQLTSYPGGGAAYLYDATTTNGRTAFLVQNPSSHTIVVHGTNITGHSNVLASTFLMLNTYNGANSASFINGLSTPFISGSLATSNISTMLLGNRFSLNENWNGHICEMLIYQGSLPFQNRQTVEGYLASKWGLQGMLPISHPYRFVSPMSNNYDFTSSLINFEATNYSGSGTWSNTGLIGASYNAVVENGTPSKNIAGNGVVFNGATNFLFPNVALGNAWTVSVWAKRTGANADNACILTQFWTGTGIMNFLMLFTSGAIQGGFYNSQNRVGAATTMPLNTWLHLSYTWNGSNVITYVNGVSTNVASQAVPALDANNPYRIGRRWDLANYFVGEVGQILMYTRPLAPSEVLQVYNRTSSIYTV